ncbi:MAG: hypothetical protein V1874_07690 [Spirochaetota bacterium]
MRDDLSGLFGRLLSLYKEKLRCIDTLKSNEINLRYLLQSGNESGIPDALLADDEIFIRLDSVEFDIRSITELICRTTGIVIAKFEEYFLGRNEDPLPEIKRFKTEIDIQLSVLIKERDMLIHDMEKKLADLKLDIRAFKIIRNYKSD